VLPKKVADFKLANVFLFSYSRGCDILNGRSVLINLSADADILLTKSILLNIYCAVVRLMTFHVNCGSNLLVVIILVNNLGTSACCSVYTTDLCSYLIDLYSLNI
jgi:hypothetical protein